MNDLTDHLARLNGGDASPADETTVAADLQRGRRANRNRRLFRIATSGVAVLAVGGVGTALVVGNQPSDAPTATSKAPHPTTTAIDLVDYTGDQLTGFTVAKVPDGFVLQGSNAYALDIALPNDHTDLNSFVGKVVVMLLSKDEAVDTTGTPVTVNGNQGYLVQKDAATSLEYTDGTHEVLIQAWDGIGLTDDQLVELAEGVTVTKDAQQGVG